MLSQGFNGIPPAPAKGQGQSSFYFMSKVEIMQIKGLYLGDKNHSTTKSSRDTHFIEEGELRELLDNLL